MNTCIGPVVDPFFLVGGSTVRQFATFLKKIPMSPIKMAQTATSTSPRFFLLLRSDLLHLLLLPFKTILKIAEVVAACVVVELTC